MDRLGYTAMTAASRTMSSLQVRANNLANVNTPGFRADLEQATSMAVQGYVMTAAIWRRCRTTA